MAAARAEPSWSAGAGRALARAARLIGGLLATAILLGYAAWPAAAAASLSGGWSHTRVGGGGIGALSCPTTGLCVALDAIGRAYASTDPTGGAATWKATTIAGIYDLDVLSCASNGVCVVGDQYGNLAATNDAAGGAWTQATPIGNPNVPPPDAFASVSCQVGLCVAVTQNGKVVSSTNPAAGASAWRIVRLPHVSLEAISCPSARLCVALGHTARRSVAITSTDPTGPASAWHSAEVNGGFNAVGGAFNTVGLSCPTTRLCVAVTGFGAQVLSSTDPLGGSRAWRSRTIGGELGGGGGPSEGGGGVSCATTRLCVAVFGLSNTVLTSTDPTGGAGSWVASQIRGTDDLFSLSCPASTLCAAGAAGGNVLTTTDPAAPAELAPRFSRAALSAAGKRSQKLTLTVSAAPDAAGIQKLLITQLSNNVILPYSRGRGAVLRGAHGQRLRFTITRSGAIKLRRPQRRVSITFRGSALQGSRLVTRVRKRRARSLLLEVNETDSQGTTITSTAVVKAS